MSKYKPGDMLRFKEHDGYPEVYALVLAIKNDDYIVHYFQTGVVHTFSYDWIDYMNDIELVE